MKRTCFILLSLLAGYTMSPAQGNYTFDKNHSRLFFSVMHLGISHVEGTFKEFTATLVSKQPDFTDAKIEMEADVNSIDTDVKMRDNDLKSEGWFNAEKYPKIIFKSTALKKVSNTDYKLEGNLTMHGITKPVIFNVMYNGKVKNPNSGKNTVGFTVTGKLDRKDFDIGSGNTVGNDVDVRSNVEFVMD